MALRCVRYVSSGERLAFPLALTLLCAITSCSRITGFFGSKGGPQSSVELAGLRLGMTEQEINAACERRAIKPIIRRSYGGFDEKGRSLPSTPTPAQAAPGEQRFLAHMTCGSSAGLTDIAFPPRNDDARAVVIRHDDTAPTRTSVEASEKALSDEFGDPSKRATDKIVHSGLDKLSLEWVVPKGARDCRDLSAKAEEPNLSIPEDCGYVYSTEIFSKDGVVSLTKSSLADVAEMVRTHQRYLAQLYGKQAEAQ